MRELTTHPDPVLKQKCRALSAEEIKTGVVDGINLRELISDMTLIMRDARRPGVGLAAPQVGVAIRLFIVDLPGRNTDPLVCINPEIVEAHGSEEAVEGCLSLPNVKVNVKRAKQIKLKATNINGVEFDMDAQALLARVIQHENDHLNGIMILQKGPSGSKKNKEALDEMERVYKRWHERRKPIDTEAKPATKEA